MLSGKIQTSLEKLDKTFFTGLNHWFKKNRRELPWRENRSDPYRVWIAEVMLQQTQSETVKEFYFRWMKRFPTLESLARYRNRKERETQILSLWQGLGYYRRALNILRAAEGIHSKYDGFPSSRTDLLALPGIGPYTAGAILNFGFSQGKPPAMVDGNFQRVFSRLFHLSPEESKSSKLIWKIAEALLDHPANTRPRVYNEAVMELGALICRRDNPLCSACPCQQNCLSFKLGKPDHSPFTNSRKIIPVHSTAVILTQGARFLLMRKEESSPLSSLWRFPVVDRHPENIDAPDSCRKLFLENLGIRLAKPCFGFSLLHHYTKYRVNLGVWTAEYGNRTDTPRPIKSQGQGEIEWEWMTLTQLNKIGLSSPDQKIRHHLLTRDRKPNR